MPWSSNIVHYVVPAWFCSSKDWSRQHFYRRFGWLHLSISLSSDMYLRTRIASSFQPSQASVLVHPFLVSILSFCGLRGGEKFALGLWVLVNVWILLFSSFYYIIGFGLLFFSDCGYPLLCSAWRFFTGIPFLSALSIHSNDVYKVYHT